MGANMKNTSRGKTRFPVLTPSRLTPAQRRLARSLLAGPRGEGKADREAVRRLLRRGPFNAWMRSPELGEHLQKAGAYIRFKTSLPKRLNEFAILITARHWTSQFEWYAHEPIARKAGIAEGVIAAIRAGRRPALSDPDQQAVYDYAAELHETHTVSQQTYARAHERFGTLGVVQLTALLGYYTMVAMTLNTHAIPLPEGAAPPLPLRALK